MQHVKLLSASEDNFLSVVYQQLQSGNKEDCSSLGQTQVQDILLLQQVKNFSCTTSSINAEKKDYQHLVPPFKEKYFNDSELSYLCKMYDCLLLKYHDFTRNIKDV